MVSPVKIFVSCVSVISYASSCTVDVFVTSECIHLHILCCISLYPDVPIMRIINIIKSCKVIEVNPPL